MIEQLTTEIKSASAQLDTMRKEINDAVFKIDTTNAQFQASYQLVFGQIQEDVRKITSFVQ